MSVMYPTEVPPKAQKAEKELFKQIAKRLPDDYIGIHGTSWIYSNNGRGQEGECDFIVIHPSKGMLFIETKAGRHIIYDAKQNRWFWGNGKPLYSDPVKQATRCLHALTEFLRDRIPYFNLPHHFAVAFPEAHRISKNLPPKINSDMVILRSDFDWLQKKVDKAIAVMRPPRRPPLEPEAFDQMINTLLPTFEITSSLSDTVDENERIFFRLEKDQIQILDLFETNKRVIVKGCAGSGKTIIAVEKAIRMSQEGQKVLLLCFNKLLANYLQKRVTEHKADVDVFTFHGLCEHVVTSNGGQFIVPDINDRTFWDETSARLLAQGIPSFTRRYDGIIVDEGQDFCSGWWEPLFSLLSDPNNGVFYILLDPKQDIFKRRTALPFDSPVMTLNINHRNTKRISRQINKITGSRLHPSANVPPGSRPVFETVKDDQAERGTVFNILDRLISKEGLKTDQIMILNMHRLKKSCFASRQTLGNFKIVDAADYSGKPHEIRYSTVHRFKGLDAPCILLTGVGTERQSNGAVDRTALFYVAASRAKSLLYVFQRPGTVWH